ncbi:S8 family peptidase [Marinimicrobium sp. ABcell2]|uniref:S8 family peptidase n=1 Tax=Marinimicrobium sp. ABcell2 TaxID=3069751 RepID=UPI0027B6F707|nr:S8 family peptidase [Marinimicrobium sp. ABcell2]MDQ2076640.1 S8 family peptidase [Marinimicrobium sp. ABcell2]
MSCRFITVLFTGVLALLSGCGGEGSGISGGQTHGSVQGQSEYAVTVVITGAGDALPERSGARAGERVSIDLLPAEGFRVANAKGCGGSLEQTRFTTSALEGDCTVEVEFIPKGGISGALLPVYGSVVDETINDTRATLGENTACEQAQEIDNRAVLHGFVSSEGTGGDPAKEHFAEMENPGDFYRVSLGPGQVVQLEVADHEQGENELGLYLWSADCSRAIASSTRGEDVEHLSVPMGGERVIEVRAKERSDSKYVLRVTTAWESSHYDEDDLETYSAEVPELVPGEIIISFAPNADSRAHEVLSAVLERVKGRELSFLHQDLDRPTLARVADTVDFSRLTLAMNRAMENLKERNETAYQVIETLQLADFLSRQPGVEFAEPNYILRPQVTPNDPGFPHQWHYDQIDLPQAWQLTLGGRTDGEDVVVAVLDTGVYLDHVDLRDQLLPGYDFHDRDSDPDENNGTSGWHGTHVAGTIAASTHNGRGVSGVSWRARILPVRVLGESGGTRYNVIQGVRYAAGLSNDSGTLPERRADVINMSLGGGGHSGAEQNLYQRVRREGVLLVAAAGNSGNDQPMYPAAYEGVLSVGATDCADRRAGYSNFGPTLSLSAPGGGRGCFGTTRGGILSTMGQGSDDARESSYGWLQGTSMAAPHVAGVLALMRAVYPDLTPSQVDTLLANGDLTDDVGLEQLGRGRINAAKAVEAAQNLAYGDVAARVAASPSVLYLGHDSSAVLDLVQESEGFPLTVIDIRSDDWLTIREVDVDRRGLGRYRVEVDRSAFDEADFGEQSGEVRFSFDNDTEVIVATHIQVGFATEVAPIYVLLLDAATGEPVREVPARWNGAGELRYRIEGIAPGDYFLVAGSDIDADEELCQVGEMCGAYPSYEVRRRVSVNDSELMDMNISLDILTRLRAFEAEPVMRMQ